MFHQILPDLVTPSRIDVHDGPGVAEGLQYGEQGLDFGHGQRLMRGVVSLAVRSARDGEILERVFDARGFARAASP